MERTLKSMNVLDAGLLMMESPETPMHIGGVQVLRLPRGAGKDYVRKLHDRYLAIPVTGAPFNYRLAPRGGSLGMPAWEVLDEVPLQQHLFHHALPWPGGERELLELVSRLNSGLLDRSRPLWEHHLIEGLEGRRYATFTRIHHALIDGKWGMKLAHETTSPNPRQRGLPPYWAVRFDAGDRSDETPEPVAGAQESWWQRQRSANRHREEAGAELRKAFGRLIESFRHPSDDGLVPIYTAPECMLNGKLTARRELAVVRLDLPRIQRLARAREATVNEVVLTLCGGALRRYLSERAALPDKALIANMPIARPRPKGESGGNSIVSGMVSLATHLDDPVQRLDTVRGSSQHAKELVREMPSTAALSVYLAVTGLPFIVAQAFGRVEKVHPQNLVISNVPGPRERRYINGALLEAEYPMSLLVPGQAMNITVVSHADCLDVAVLVCPDLVPDPHGVTVAIAASLDELEHALRPRRTREKSSPPTLGARPKASADGLGRHKGTSPARSPRQAQWTRRQPCSD
jgi:diacylglycerol O-acyltransferase